MCNLRDGFRNYTGMPGSGTNERQRRKQMNVKKMCLVAAVVVMALGLVGAALAGPPGHGPGPGQPGGAMEALQTFLKLNLSSDQRSAMLAVMDRYESRKQTLLSSLMMARDNARTVLEAEAFDEYAVRGAMQAVAAAEEDLVVLTGKMMMELKGLLTANQAALLKANRPGAPRR
jgi:Spy/CpxP family protein refolding chaperone